MLKILVAEDNVLLGDFLEDFLVSGGYDVCGVARTVAEAVDLADRYKPDLAVLDFRLAHGEFGSQIRPLLKDKTSMGILYASGDLLNHTLTRADGVAYIQKPYGMHDMLDALRIVQQIQTSNDSLIAPALFPKSFHLLSDPINNSGVSA